MLVQFTFLFADLCISGFRVLLKTNGKSKKNGRLGMTLLFLFANNYSISSVLFFFCALCTQDSAIGVAFLHKINQSINQSINQLINQLVNQPIDRSINQSIDRSINRSINQSINQSIDQSINQSVDQSINQSINQLINQSTNQSINQSITLQNI